MTDSTHTLTPWYTTEIIESGIGMQKKTEWPIYAANGKYAHPATATNAADAEFIVRAVNSHQELLDALQAIVEFEESYTVKPGVSQHDLINKAKAAIAHAEAR
jgi:hypothetical protein